MYDTTFSDSLQGVKEWFSDMKEKVDLTQVVICLLGNKVDDYDNNQITLKQADIVKLEIEANIFEEVSAKQNLKVTDVMDRLAKELLDR